MSKVSELVKQLEEELESARQSSREYLLDCIKLNMEVDRLQKLLKESKNG